MWFENWNDVCIVPTVVINILRLNAMQTGEYLCSRKERQMD